MGVMDKIDLRPLEFGMGRAIVEEMVRNDPQFGEAERALIDSVTQNPHAYFGAATVGELAAPTFASRHIVPLIETVFLRLMSRAPENLIGAYKNLVRDVRRFGMWREFFLSSAGVDGDPVQRIPHLPAIDPGKISRAYKSIARWRDMAVFRLDDDFVPSLFGAIAAPWDKRFAFRMGFDLLNGYAVLQRYEDPSRENGGIKSAYKMAFGDSWPYYAPVKVQQHTDSDRIYVEMQRSAPAFGPFEPFVSGEVRIRNSGRIVLNIEDDRRPVKRPLIFSYEDLTEKPISPPARPLYRVEVPHPKGIESREFAGVLQMASRNISRAGARIFFEGFSGICDLEVATPDQLTEVADDLAISDAAALMAVGVESAAALTSIYTSVVANAPIA